MNKFALTAAVLALLFLGQPRANAIIVVATDFPTENGGVGLGQATSKSQLSDLVGLYSNDVALLVASDENYSDAIKETVPNSAIEEELRKRALAGSDSLTMQSLASAVSEMVRAAPQNAPLIMASAIALLSDLPGGDSPANRITLAQTALLAIPPDQPNGADYAARVIGVTAKGQKGGEVAQTVISLRDFSTSGVPVDQQVASTLSLDEALVSEGVLRPTIATPEFVTLAQAYSTAPVPATGFSGDQGVTNAGGFGGFGGSSGGSGNSGGNNPSPTPTPTPTPAPTPAS